MSDYFSIDDILCEEERTPVTFRFDARELGYLDPSSGNEHVRKNTKVDLPFWLANALFQSRLVNVEQPKCFHLTVRNDLEADASVYSFARMPYFYELGMRMALLTQDRELVALMVKVFAARQRDVLDRSQNWRNEDVSEFTRRLSVCERALFYAGYKPSLDLQHWRTGASARLTAATYGGAAVGAKRNVHGGVV